MTRQTMGRVLRPLVVAIVAVAATTGSSVAAAPAIGHGQQIVAVSSGSGPQIEMLQPNGRSHVIYRGLNTEAASISDLSFSDSGNQLAFTEAGGNPDRAVIVLDLASQRVKAVPTDRLTGESPSFLRDGRIVFSGGREGANRQGGTYSVRPDGSGLHRLFGRRELATDAAGDSFVATDPKGSSRSLFLLDRKGRVERRIAGPTPPHVEDLDPTLSPDGRLVVYTEEHFLGAKVHGILYAVRRDGTHRRRLTFGPESATEASFSPDGSHIVFTVSPTMSGGGLFVLPLVRLTKPRAIGLSAGFHSPAWGSR